MKQDLSASKAKRKLQAWIHKAFPVCDFIRGQLRLDLRRNPFTVHGLEAALHHPALQHVTNLFVDENCPDELAAALLGCPLRASVNGIPVSNLRDNTALNINAGLLDSARLSFIAPFISPCTSLHSLELVLDDCSPEAAGWMRLFEVIVNVFQC